MIMGILVACSSLALFQSYNYMGAGIASTLLFVYPIMVALIMAFCIQGEIDLTDHAMHIAGLGGDRFTL